MRNWAGKWKVTFEPSKFKAMTVSKKSNSTRSDVFSGDIKLPYEDGQEILSVTVDSKLTWNKYISNITTRAGQKLGAQRKVDNQLNVVERTTVYKAQARSVIEYTSLCWMSTSTTTRKPLDSIQNKALMIIVVDEQQTKVDLNITSQTSGGCYNSAVQNAHPAMFTRSEADASLALCG